jgi:hypothetical protein
MLHVVSAQVVDANVFGNGDSKGFGAIVFVQLPAHLPKPEEGLLHHVLRFLWQLPGRQESPAQFHQLWTQRVGYMFKRFNRHFEYSLWDRRKTPTNIN